MKYAKPEIVVVGTAFASVKSGQKGFSQVPDSLPAQTIGAYEADE